MVLYFAIITIHVCDIFEQLVLSVPQLTPASSRKYHSIRKKNEWAGREGARCNLGTDHVGIVSSDRCPVTLYLVAAKYQDTDMNMY